MGRVIPVLVGLFVLGIGFAIFLHFRNAPEPPSAASPPATSQPPATPASPTYDTARATLARLPVKGWDRNTDFVRYRFGQV